MQIWKPKQTKPKPMHEMVAVITGAANGIGRGIAKYLSKRDFAVIIVDTDKEGGEEIANEISNIGKALFIECDVSNEASVASMAKTAKTHFGGLHALVNNAGIFGSGSKPIEQTTIEEFRRVLDVNLTGMFLCAKHLRGTLKEFKGSIVNISSTRAIMSEPDTLAYSASKGGILSLTHALAISLAPEIRVNAISPGWIETRNWQKSSKLKPFKHSEIDRSQHPAGRVGTVEDVAGMVNYLVGKESRFVTGQNFIVDGGMTRKMIYV